MTDTKATASGRTAGAGTVRWSDGGAFGVLPLWVLETEVSDRAKVLYAYLASRAGAEGATVRGQREMEEWLRCGRTAVKNALRELSEISAITIEATSTEIGGRGRNEYVVHAIPPRRADDEAPRRGGVHLPYRDPEEQDSVEEEPSTGVGVALATLGADEDPVPKSVQIGGRNLPFDALREVCRIHPRSPRVREIPSALNGSGKGRPGIRALAWEEAPPDARSAPVAFELWLADEIPRRVDAYRAALPGAIVTPQALAKWWVDVRHAPTSAAQSAFEIAQEETRRMEEGR